VRPLGTLGISESEEQVYRWLLAHPDATARETSDALVLELRKTQHVLNALENIGFVTHSPQLPRRYIPASPDIAVTAFVRRRREELDRALTVVPELRRQAVRREGIHERVVELITSRDAERQIYEQLPEVAQEEILTLIRPPLRVSRLDLVTDAHHAPQRRAQARGIRYRSIIDSTFFELPGAVNTVRADAAAGEEVRVLSHLPFKMWLADRRTALIPLNLEQIDSPSLLVRSSALLDALYALFGILWERAAPISFTSSGDLAIGEAGVSAREEMGDLIALLAAGLNDKVIVDQLGVSRRTLLRRVSELMRQLNARTRFQAGWLAASHLPARDREFPQ
jgi:sugar-specific transcriptional regulator TrmB/DNA-binding CsgD family transcriptional regulator